MRRSVSTFLLTLFFIVSIGPALHVSAAFLDVPTDEWYAQSVEWAVDKGITVGTSATTFSPDKICSQAEIITFLWRANGSPAPHGTTAPYGVPAGQYYSNAAIWAAEKGIIEKANPFPPDQPCTRAMVVDFLWKNAGSPTPRTTLGLGFADVPSDAFYMPAVSWAAETGVTSGTSIGAFSPNKTCSRAEIVTFLYRACGGGVDAECALASALGFGTVNDPDSAVTYHEFITMLDRAVELLDSGKTADWVQHTSDGRNSSDIINKGNAALAVFSAAEILGGDVYARNAYDIGEGAFIGEWEPAAFWGDVDRVPAGFEDMTIDTGEGSFSEWSSHYVMSRGSVVTGKTIFDYPAGDSYVHADEPLTNAEALHAALRFYESAIDLTKRSPNGEDASLFARVDTKKQEILNSSTNITYTGTAYYVSNTGNDGNSGTSPENAWATTERVNSAKYDGTLHDGDAVFFERGGLWRGWINCAPGVTYSAYGEGEKPRIYGSSEDGTGASKWSLWYDVGGIKIWKYYRDMTEVGNIVFDGGSSYATRIYSYYNGKNWVVSGTDQRPFDVAENLRDDLTFYSTFDLSREDYAAIKESNVGTEHIAGPLYLRCDAGNPGEIYQEIEFHQSPADMSGYIGLVTPAGNNVIDNLSIKYCLMNGIAIYGYDNANSGHNKNVVQNCEIAWTGGDQHDLNRPEGDVMVCGENIVCKTDDNVFRNNYMYQSACGGFVFEFVENEWTPETCSEGNIIEGNVIERCQDCFWFWDNDVGELDYLLGEHVFFNNITIRGNYVMYMGYGWSGDPRFIYPANINNTYHGSGSYWAFSIGGNPKRVADMTATDNVFYLTNGGHLIWVDIYGDLSGILFSGNVYVENDNRDILNSHELCLTAEEISECLKEYIGDDNAIVFDTSVPTLTP